jgi:VPDSG-CTERM motif
MKALPKKLLPLTLFAIAVISLFSVRPARAYTVTLQQVGSNVVANGSGAINLTGLTFSLPGSLLVGIRSLTGVILTGPTGSTADVGLYAGFTGPTNFGSGRFFLANTGSGDLVGIEAGEVGGVLAVPPGYVSNTALSSSSTWNNATFASLDVIPGTYVWSWGAGLPNQNVTLQIGPAGVPDGGSTVSLLGCALLGLAALRRKLVKKTLPPHHHQKITRWSLFAVALMACSPLQTRADTIAFSASSNSFLATENITATLGYSFTLSSPVRVTNLGLFDSANDGLVQSHTVTIWTSTGMQELQATIPAGTSGTLINGFRYVSIAPFLLVPGAYTIGGFYGQNSDFSLVQASITSASGVSYVGSRSARNLFVFPTGDAFGFSNGYFGPNFQFTTAVPTPDSGFTVSLLGFALLGLAALRRKLPLLRGTKS